MLFAKQLEPIHSILVVRLRGNLALSISNGGNFTLYSRLLRQVANWIFVYWWCHTTLTASTEAIDVNFNLARTVQFATGALPIKERCLFRPDLWFVIRSTTTTTTLELGGAPTEGTNATITFSRNGYSDTAHTASNGYGLLLRKWNCKRSRGDDNYR